MQSGKPNHKADVHCNELMSAYANPSKQLIRGNIKNQQKGKMRGKRKDHSKGVMKSKLNTNYQWQAWIYYYPCQKKTLNWKFKNLHEKSTILIEEDRKRNYARARIVSRIWPWICSIWGFIRKSGLAIYTLISIYFSPFVVIKEECPAEKELSQQISGNPNEEVEGDWGVGESPQGIWSKRRD